MVIITKRKIKDFADETNRQEVINAFNRWYQIAHASDWTSLADVKKDFKEVDFVGDDLYVFNIMGNHYRLIARIIFGARTILSGL